MSRTGQVWEYVDVFGDHGRLFLVIDARVTWSKSSGWWHLLDLETARRTVIKEAILLDAERAATKAKWRRVA